MIRPSTNGPMPPGVPPGLRMSITLKMRRGPIAREAGDDGNLVQHDGCDSRCQTEQPRWVSLPLPYLPPRLDPAVAYDSARGRIVLFGGQDPKTGSYLGDTWEWNGYGWIEMSP